jgi:hypothetical protein
LVDPAAVVTVIDVGVTAAIVPRTRFDGAADAPGEAAASEFTAVVWPGCEQATSDASDNALASVELVRATIDMESSKRERRLHTSLIESDP